MLEKIVEEMTGGIATAVIGVIFIGFFAMLLAAITVF